MENFSNLITEPNINQKADTNEIIGVLLAGSLLAYTCWPFVKGTSMGLAAFFKNIFTNDNDDKKEKDEKDNSEATKNFNYLLMLSKASNQKEKDKNIKQKNDALIKLLTACSFDKDGNEIPLEDRINKMKDSMSKEQFEVFKKDMTEAYEKNKNDKNFKDALVKAKSNIKPEEYDKMLEDAKKEAKNTLAQLEKERKEIEDYEEKLLDLDDKINGRDEKDIEIRKLKRQLEELKKNPPQTIVSAATGVSTNGDSTSENKEDPKKPEEYSNEEIEKMQDELSDLDPEKDKDKIKEKNELLKSIAKAKGKSEDEYQVKAESDKEGRPLQRKTGPRGGKYFRVKVDGQWGVWQSDTNESLKNYLLRLLND